MRRDQIIVDLLREQNATLLQLLQDERRRFDEIQGTLLRQTGLIPSETEVVIPAMKNIPPTRISWSKTRAKLEAMTARPMDAGWATRLAEQEKEEETA